MNRLRRILRSEGGFALPVALVLMLLGGLLIVPSVSLVGTSLKAHHVVDRADHRLYAADAGMEHGIWRLIYDDTFTPPSVGGQVQWQLDEQINGATVTVTFRREATDIYKITSTAIAADGSRTTIESYAQYSAGGNSIFNNAIASLAGNISIPNGALVKSKNLDGTDGRDGDVYANGNVILGNNGEVRGDASATGTVTGGTVTGERTNRASPLDADALRNEMNIKIAEWKADAMNITCASCSTSYTRTGNPWTAPVGDYPNNEYVQNAMSITASSGTWNFGQTVCVGAFTNRDMTVGGGGTKTFNGPVTVGGNLIINASGGTITFRDSVCVGGNLAISGGATVVFQGKVKVGGALSFANAAVPVQFRNTVWVSGNVSASTNNASLTLGNILYVQGAINISNNSWVNGGQNIIADGDISVDNNAGFNFGVSPMVIPFLISTGGNVQISNNGIMTRAIIYAPATAANKGVITISNNGQLMGSAVGKAVTLSNNAVVQYPMEFQSRTDLPGSGGGSPGAGPTFQSYTISINPR